MMTNLWLSLLGATLISGLAASMLYLSDAQYESISPYLLSLSAGTIFGGVFIHLVFRLTHQYSYGRMTGVLVIAGIGGSIVLERIVHWHCHHTDTHAEPLPYILATGDAIHNVLDGMLIAASFLASTTAGLSATIAVVAHKIPKEFGDFGVMVEYGFSKPKAIATNIILSLLMFIGAAIVVLIAGEPSQTVPILLPLVIGNFLYVAGTDLLPSFTERPTWKRHMVVFSIGVAIMYSIPYLKAIVL